MRSSDLERLPRHDIFSVEVKNRIFCPDINSRSLVFSLERRTDAFRSHSGFVGDVGRVTRDVSCGKIEGVKRLEKGDNGMSSVN